MHIMALMLAIVFFITGVAGTILPILPGVTLIYAGMVLYGFLTNFITLEPSFFFIQGIAVVLIFVLDYLAAMIGTRKMGGSKYAAFGAVAGGILCIFWLGPLGLLMGAFLGAFLVELLSQKEPSQALRAGIGTLLGVVGGTILKLGVEALMIAWFFMSIRS